METNVYYFYYDTIDPLRIQYEIMPENVMNFSNLVDKLSHPANRGQLVFIEDEQVYVIEYAKSEPETGSDVGERVNSDSAFCPPGST